MMTQTSLPILVTTPDCQKLINPSLLCQFFSESLGRSSNLTYPAAVILNSLSKITSLIHHTYMSFRIFSYPFMANNKAKKSLNLFSFFKKLITSILNSRNVFLIMDVQESPSSTVLLARLSDGILELWRVPSQAIS